MFNYSACFCAIFCLMERICRFAATHFQILCPKFVHTEHSIFYTKIYSHCFVKFLTIVLDTLYKFRHLLFGYFVLLG